MNGPALSENVNRNDNTNLNATAASSADKSRITMFREWRQRHSFLSLVLEIVVLVVFVVIPFRTLVAQPFQVYGDSMLPNFTDNDYLIVNQINTNLGNGPDRFDVVVFKFPGNDQDYYIKRVIGLPGERVVVQNGGTVVYNETNPDGLTIDDEYVQGRTFGNIDTTLGTEEYFVMGDNRENSSDSRSWGALPRKNIIGSPLIRLYPFNQIDVNPGGIEP